jgi:serine/threonine protein kinase
LGHGSSNVNCVEYINPNDQWQEENSTGRKRKKKRFAEKIMLIEHCDVADTIYRELSVIRNRARFDCPYIVQSYEAFFFESAVHIIMEKMDCSLKDILKKISPRGLSLTILQAILTQILRGLDFLHSPHIISSDQHHKNNTFSCLHRDIKPENILLSKKHGAVKLADFGCLKMLCSDVDAHTFLGTKVYMSPERLRSDPYTASADIWSIGVVAYECAFGRFPFKIPDPQSFAAVLLAIGKPVRLPPPQNDLPPITDFIKKCLSKDPTLRPSAKELLEHPFIRQQQMTAESIVDGGGSGGGSSSADDHLHAVVRKYMNQLNRSSS